MAFTNFSTTGGQSAGTLNGSLTLGVQSTAAFTGVEALSTPSPSIGATFGGQTRTRTLTGFSASATMVPSPTSQYATTFNTSGSVRSSGLGSQSVGFSTPTPFMTHGSALYPESGVMRLQGAAKSSVRITAQSGLTAQIELDANGDGTYETRSTVAWSTRM